MALLLIFFPGLPSSPSLFFSSRNGSFRRKLHPKLVRSFSVSMSYMLMCIAVFILLGLDEEAHWFVCKSGFQSRCKNLMHVCDNDPGFFNFIDRDSDRKGFVKEVWKRNCFHQALVKGKLFVHQYDLCIVWSRI